MPPPIKLPLRGDRHVVTLIRPNGSPGPVLGTQSPQEDDRRARVAESLQVPTHRGRPADKPVGIEEALPVRSQTVLSHRLPPEVRRLVNGDLTDAASASRKVQGNIGVGVDIELG